MDAEIITIGTELLLGEIVDTNTRAIALWMRDLGINLFQTHTVGDNVERIADVVRDSLSRVQIVITTGGLGPTVDDATRLGIAKAIGVEVEFQTDLWQQIEERFAQFGVKPTENNRQQAMIPSGSIPVKNPVGTAPGFISIVKESAIIALPGVPAEMRIMFENEVIPFLKGRLKQREVIKSRIVRTAGLGESWIDQKIEDLEQLSNPTVGLAAHPGRVDIRITVKASTDQEADEQLFRMEATLRQRLGNGVYGIDDVSLEEVVLQMILDRGWRLVVVESGTEGALSSSLCKQNKAFAGGRVYSRTANSSDLFEILQTTMQETSAEVGLGAVLYFDEAGTRVKVRLITGEADENFERSFGGALAYPTEWAASIALEALRQILLSN